MRTPVLAAVLLLVAGGAHAKEAPPKPGKVHALTTKKHGRAYALYVPSKYSKKSSWPLVISSHGRGGSGAGEMRAWQGLANSHGFIVACPDMVTATHDRPKTSNLPAAQEDDEVLLSIFEEVCERFNVNRLAVMITGFSGGGNPSYHSGLRHPDVFTHICTRGGNFAPQQIPTDESVLEAGRKSLHIYIFFGDKDHELIIGPNGDDGQAYQARDALKKAGYENVEFERVPGMGHQSRPEMAAKWFGAYLEENKKRFKAHQKVVAHVTKAAKAVEKQRYKQAIAEFRKAQELAAKAGIPATGADTGLAALHDVGRKLLDEARGTREGDPKAALKACEKIAREWKGLPVADEARKLVEEWKRE